MCVGPVNHVIGPPYQELLGALEEAQAERIALPSPGARALARTAHEGAGGGGVCRYGAKGAERREFAAICEIPFSREGAKFRLY